MARPRNLFEDALAAEGIKGPLADVARSIYVQESGGGKNTKTSNAGAVGGMQILPGTFKQVADKDWDINDPLLNARAGIRYLKQMDKLSGGVPELTAAGYYGGPGGLEKARRGIGVSDPRNPNAPDTLRYGREVVARMGKQPAPSAVPVAAQEAVVDGSMMGPPGWAQMPNAVAATLVQAEAVPVATGPVGPDPWEQMRNSMRSADGVPMQAADLAYGYDVPKMAEAVVPDFMGAIRSGLQQQQLRPDFRAFGSWGRKA